MKQTDSGDKKESARVEREASSDYESRWILGEEKKQQQHQERLSDDDEGESGFRQAFVRNVRGVIAERRGTRIRKAAKFHDDMEAKGRTATRGGETERILRRKNSWGAIAVTEDRREQTVCKHQCPNSSYERR